MDPRHDPVIQATKKEPCKELKQIYDQCYNKWHAAMRKGAWEIVPCDDEFDDYKECYVVSKH
jgi:hypothetical protein